MKKFKDAIFWLSVIVIAGYIELKLVSQIIHYGDTHCSFHELPKDLQS